MIRSIIKIGALSFNIIAVVALLLSVSCLYLSPEKYHFSAYFGMAFLLLAFINFCFVLFWVIHLKWHFLISLLILLLFSNNLRTSVSIFKEKKESKIEGKNIKILTYNVMLFNYYKKDSKILDYVAASDADIICMQEFGYHKNGRDFLSKEKILTSFKNYPYHYINIMFDRKNVTYGVATFSKYPIVHAEQIKYDSKFNSSVFTDIKMGNDTVRIFNNHLESNKLTKKDKDNLSEKIDSEIVSLMAEKLSVATAIRAKQAEIVAGKIAESPYKVIVCGDFNDIPVSYVYRKMSKNLSDSFVGSGSGMGITFRDKLYRFRIDYILTNKNFVCSDYQIDNVKYSDHYPVSCMVKIPE